MDFKGFSRDTIAFLKNLRENNDKSWFDAHKEEYIEYLLTPFRKFVTTIGPHMHMIDPLLEISPGIGKTISRIYRDARFTKNKAPFKSSMWCTFKRPRKDWKDTPAFFVEVTAEFYRYGMGFFDVERPTMDKFRDYIDFDTDNFLKVVACFERQKKFTMLGDMYKRPLKPDMPGKIYDWYQRREIYFMRTKKIDGLLFSSELVNEVVTDFIAIAPIYNYMWKIKGA